MSQIELLSFSMRKDAPKAGADWFRIVKGKKASEPTKVYIYDEIGYWGTTAKDFAAILNDIDTTEIHLHINSPGGSVFDGLAIGAAIRDHKATVIGKVDGMAASAASFILQYCDTREISRNAQVMIHDAKAYAGGTADQMRKAADVLDRVSNTIADIYQVRSGQLTTEEWRAIMQSGDTWYDGNEALEVGLVDVVTDNPAEQEEETENSWSQEEVQAFVLTPAAALATDPKRSVVTNRVEEALMTGANPQNSKTPPAPAQPPAQPAAPFAETPTFMVNGAEVTDFAAVQAHITTLESFRTETIKSTRAAFVTNLASSNKIAATQIDSMTEFANSLSDEQFSNWKASMDAAPAQQLLAKHGVEPGEKLTPANEANKGVADEIAVLQGIVDSHKAMAMPQAEIEAKDSYKRLQQLLSQQTSA